MKNLILSMALLVPFYSHAGNGPDANLFLQINADIALTTEVTTATSNGDVIEKAFSNLPMGTYDVRNECGLIAELKTDNRAIAGVKLVKGEFRKIERFGRLARFSGLGLNKYNELKNVAFLEENNDLKVYAFCAGENDSIENVKGYLSSLKEVQMLRQR